MFYVCLCNFRSFPCFRIRSKDNHTLSQNAAQAEWCLKNFARRGNGLAFCAEVAGILLFLVLSSLGSDSIFSLCLYYSVDSRNMFQNGARKFDFSPVKATKTRDYTVICRLWHKASGASRRRSSRSLLWTAGKAYTPAVLPDDWSVFEGCSQFQCTALCLDWLRSRKLQISWS